MVGLDKIKKDVRILLDHNEVQASIEGFGEDQLHLDSIIESQVEAAARLTLLMAPRSYVNWVEFTPSYAMIGSWDSLPEGSYYVIGLPADFIRFGSAKMRKWAKAVSTYCNTTDEEYMMQQSEFAGIRATRRKPLAVIAESAEGGHELQLYPHVSGDKLQYFTYCKQPKLKKTGTTSTLDITETLYQPFVYVTGALVAEVLKDTDKNNELMAGAKLMLTNTDEAAVEAETTTTN